MANILRLAAYERAWSHCGSVTLEGKQHLVVFLHSRAASLRALRRECEPDSRVNRVRTGVGLLTEVQTNRVARAGSTPSRPKQKSTRVGAFLFCVLLTFVIQ